MYTEQLRTFLTSQETYKKLLVDQLITEIISKTNKLIPDKCNHCHKIFEPDSDIIGDNCFLCQKTMCPDCCPILHSERTINTVYFPVCSQCVKDKQPLRTIPSDSNPGTSTPVSTKTKYQTSMTTNTEKTEDKICSHYPRVHLYTQ